MMTSKNIVKEPEPKPAKSEPKKETTNERVLRILRKCRERLQSQGVPELDVEVDELIAEVEGWGDK